MRPCPHHTLNPHPHAVVIRRAAFTAAALLLIVSARGLGQATGTPARPRPFEAFSASAERLKDSVSSRLSGIVRRSSDAPLEFLNHEEAQAAQDSIVAMARAQLGVQYHWGAETPKRGFDCSGLVKFVLSVFRLDLPRTARSQSLVGRPVERDTSDLRPGDLLTFGRGKRVTHIGIYVGDGHFVHASTTSRKVVESVIGEAGSWYTKHWLGVRRLLAVADSTG